MVLGMSLLLVQTALPYEHPLDGHAVREAYFLGQRRDEKTAKLLARYLKRPPLPKTGPHVAEIEIRTPYEQVVLRASQAAGSYSAQQAEQDYRAHPDRIVVRVRINLTPTYPAFLADPSGGKGQVRERPEDFWRDFSIRLVQGERITPRNASGRPLHTGGLAGPNPVVGALEGAEVLLEFDASQIRSEPLRIEVLTPNGQTVEVEFDLKELR